MKEYEAVAIFILSWREGVRRSLRKSQQEGQEDHGEVKELGGIKTRNKEV